MDSVIREEHVPPHGPNRAIARERDRAIQDEDTAGRSDAPLLITASTPTQVEALARRIHQGSVRSGAPFVQVRAGALSTDRPTLRERCSALLDTAGGGSLFVTDVEEMPADTQGVLIDVFDALQHARAPVAAVRFISGTTVSLVDRVVAGTFSEKLFYRLNVIHLVVQDPRTDMIEDLRELIAALDRRVPHLERTGEIDIARDTAALRDKARSRIAEFERAAATRSSPASRR